MAKERIVYLSVRLTEREAATVSVAVKRAGLSKSAWVRQGLLALAERGAR